MRALQAGAHIDMADQFARLHCGVAAPYAHTGQPVWTAQEGPMAATSSEITMPHTTPDTALPISSATLTAALQQMEQTEVEQGHAIALAFSGGLDSSLCVVLAREKYHASALHAITVDVG